MSLKGTQAAVSLLLSGQAQSRHWEHRCARSIADRHVTSPASRPATHHGRRAHAARIPPLHRLDTNACAEMSPTPGPIRPSSSRRFWSGNHIPSTAFAPVLASCVCSKPSGEELLEAACTRALESGAPSYTVASNLQEQPRSRWPAYQPRGSTDGPVNARSNIGGPAPGRLPTGGTPRTMSLNRAGRVLGSRGSGPAPLTNPSAGGDLEAVQSAPGRGALCEALRRAAGARAMPQWQW